jgi:hypothetical protein
MEPKLSSHNIVTIPHNDELIRIRMSKIAFFVVGRSMTAKALLPSRIRRIQMCSLVRLLEMCDFTHLFGII